MADTVTMKGPKPKLRVRAGSAPSQRSAFVTGAFSSGAPQPYDGVGAGRRSPQYGDHGPNVVINYLDRLRRDARQMVRTNGPAYNGLLKRTGHVVGAGIRPNCEFEDLQQLWDHWAEESDFHGRFNFYTQQAFAYFSSEENGETFGRFWDVDPSTVMTVPLKVELIESDRVPTHMHDTAPNGNRIVGGIEVDDRDRPQAIWVYPRHPLDFRGDGRDFEVERVPWEDSFQIFWPDRLGALRGTPRLSRSGNRMRDLDEYHDAELARKRTTALFGGYYRTPIDDDGAVPGQLPGGDEDAGIDFQAMEPGTFLALPPGYDVTFSKPEDVGGNFEIFDRAQIAQIAAGMGILPEQLLNDFKTMASDRVWRAAATDMEPLIEMEQWHKVIPALLKTWRRFVSVAILHGLWKPPAGVEPRRYMNPEWTPPERRHTHPLQDIRSLKEAHALGVTSKKRIAGAMGYNITAIRKEIAAETAEEKKAGIFVPHDNQVAAQEAVQPDASQIEEQLPAA